MKRSLLILNNKLLVILSLLIFCLPSFARKYQVVQLGGEVFSIDKAARTRTVKTGQYVHVGDELLVEDSSKVTLLGPGDLLLHLKGGSQVRFGLETYQLMKGTTWVQHMNKKAGLVIFETANAEVEVKEGDSIIKYSETQERTDVFTLSGMSKVSHLFDKVKHETLVDGEFSFLSKKNNWVPRRPTLIGKDSFVDLKQQFAGVSPLKRNLDELYKNRANSDELKQMNRSIASLDEQPYVREEKKLETSKRKHVIRDHGEYLFISSKLKKVAKKKKKKKKKKKAKLRVFGQLDTLIVPEITAPAPAPIQVAPRPAPAAQRMPASVPDFVESYTPTPVYDNPFPQQDFSPSGDDPGDTFLQQLQNIEEDKTKIY